MSSTICSVFLRHGFEHRYSGDKKATIENEAHRGADKRRLKKASGNGLKIYSNYLHHSKELNTLLYCWCWINY